MASIGTELGQIGADIIAQIRQADAATIAALTAEIERLRGALRKIPQCHSPHSMAVIALTALETPNG